MSTAKRLLSEWKKASAAQARQAIDAAKEAKKIALKTCKLAEDLFKSAAANAKAASDEIERDADEEGDDYDEDMEIAGSLGDAPGSLDVHEHVEDAKTQLESVFDTLIEALEEAAKEAKDVGNG